MQRVYVVEKVYDKSDFTANALPQGDYEDCQFINCNFANADLSTNRFSDCEFSSCNLTMAKLKESALKSIVFKHCKLVGVHFETCDEFLFSIECSDCILKLASFFKMKLPKTKFRNCGLQEVDFAEADLSNALFERCDLQGAIFDHTILEKTDFRTSFNYSIDPEINKMKKARFSFPESSVC